VRRGIVLAIITAPSSSSDLHLARIHKLFPGYRSTPRQMLCAPVEKDLIAKVKPALRSHGRFICDRNTRRRANLFRPLNNKWRDLRVSKRICPDVGPVSFDKTAR
jgi:hypothetical protein